MAPTVYGANPNMKQPPIPKGWRVLRKWTVIREGDKYLSSHCKWCATILPRKDNRMGCYWKVGGYAIAHLIYIRRKQPKTK